MIGGVSMDLKSIIELDKKYYMNTFGDRVPVSFKYGKGINLWGTDDKKYYDFMSGIAVSALGHAHPKLVKAVSEQAVQLIHCSNLYYIENQAKLAKELVENSCADRVFFANSGAEANEGAIKLARIYYKKKGQKDKYEIITLTNSFHGRTLATVAATGQPKYQKPYQPLMPLFKHVPMNNLEELKKAVNSKTCAILLEAIQGESGVHPANYEFIKDVKKICSENDILLIFDEVQCGMGRTGKMFGFEHYDVEPDIFTLAKGLGGGVPIGAVLAKEKIAKAFEPGDHGSTFGGNPLACAAGLAVMEAIKEENLIENAAKMGEYFNQKLTGLAEKHPVISEVRGKGLMIGVEFKEEIAVEVKNKCFDKGYLVGSVGTNIIRILPPLIITTEDIDGMVSTLDEVLSYLNR